MKKKPTVCTIREKAFAVWYPQLKDAKQAAIKAGYCPNNAAVIGCNLLKRERVQKEIEKNMSRAAHKLGITPEQVLDALWDTVQRCRQAEPVLDKEGNPIGQYKFDAANVHRGLELIGKHLKMFTDRVEASVSISHEEALSELE